MKKPLKIALFVTIALITLMAATLGGFIYKVKYGFPVTYETERPKLSVPDNTVAVLLFSKTTGFRHAGSIVAAKEVFAKMAGEQDWFLYATEEGGIFNDEQLSQFDVVIFNNSTGRVLNDEQRASLQEFVEGGGSLIGIHGAGDDSHRWPWYVESMTGSTFSHHAMNPQLQETAVTLSKDLDSLLQVDVTSPWIQTDEWYVFFEHPKDRGFTIVATIDGSSVSTNGNMLWMDDKNFGMGKEHPVAWYRNVGLGCTFYTSMGHDANVWKEGSFVKLMENAIARATK